MLPFVDLDTNHREPLASAVKSIGRLEGSVSNQEGTIKKLKTLRLDRQGNTSDKAANIHIQVNQKEDHTTIGQVLVSQAAFKAANTHATRPDASDKLLAAFTEAMIKSHGDGGSYEIQVA